MEKMNKKAQMATMLNWVFIRLPILIIVVIFFVIALTSYFSTGLDTHETDDLIIVTRLIYSDKLLAFKDRATDRVYPGVIDKSKFRTENLESQLVNKNSRLAINLELTNLETGESENIYVNEDRAKTWDDYLALGGFDSSVYYRYVEIYDNEITQPGLLKIKLLVKQ